MRALAAKFGAAAYYQVISIYCYPGESEWEAHVRVKRARGMTDEYVAGVDGRIVMFGPHAD